MEYARVAREMDLPADRVWRVVRDFAEIAGWIAGVTDCVLENGPAGIGAIRVASLSGRRVREQLLAIDDGARRLTYAVLAPHSLPAENVRSTILVEPVDEQRARATWFSEADLTATNPELTRRVEDFFAASLARLEQRAAGCEV